MLWLPCTFRLADAGKQSHCAIWLSVSNKQGPGWTIGTGTRPHPPPIAEGQCLERGGRVVLVGEEYTASPPLRLLRTLVPEEAVGLLPASQIGHLRRGQPIQDKIVQRLGICGTTARIARQIEPSRRGA